MLPYQVVLEGINTLKRTLRTHLVVVVFRRAWRCGRGAIGWTWSVRNICWPRRLCCETTFVMIAQSSIPPLFRSPARDGRGLRSPRFVLFASFVVKLIARRHGEPFGQTGSPRRTRRARRRRVGRRGLNAYRL